MLDKWVYERGIRIDFSRPGTPMDNATVESFNTPVFTANLECSGKAVRQHVLVRIVL
jgi:transposase InsO family protein